MNALKRYRLFLLIVVFDVVVLLVRPEVGTRLFAHSWDVAAQMLAVLPPIFVLLGLLDAWVPRETVIRFVGERSGALGLALSIVLGAAAAGPLYAAFPIARTMARKGASYVNILVFLGAWSTLKVPMLLFELSALGVRFAVTRWLVNVVGIIGLAWLINRLLRPADRALIAGGDVARVGQTAEADKQGVLMGRHALFPFTRQSHNCSPLIGLVGFARPHARVQRASEPDPGYCHTGPCI